jgi:hypothetical protein
MFFNIFYVVFFFLIVILFGYLIVDFLIVLIIQSVIQNSVISFNFYLVNTLDRYTIISLTSL